MRAGSRRRFASLLDEYQGSPIYLHVVKVRSDFVILGGAFNANSFLVLRSRHCWCVDLSADSSTA